MPCIILVGYPCSGKTTRVNQLISLLKEQGDVNILTIDDSVLNIEKSIIYSGYF